MPTKNMSLIPGVVYWDKVHKDPVEFGYMGQTGYAIVYEPGDSGGGMQSSWGVKPENLEHLTDKYLRQMERKKHY